MEATQPPTPTTTTHVEEDRALRTLRCLQRTVEFLRRGHRDDGRDNGPRGDHGGGCPPPPPTPHPPSSSSGPFARTEGRLRELARDASGLDVGAKTTTTTRTKVKDEEGNNPANEDPPCNVDDDEEGLDEGSCPLYLVDRVLIPLVSALANSYAALDSDGDHEGNNKKVDPRHSTTSSSTKPKAPAGLISLHQYADVASLIECLVVMSIVVMVGADNQEVGAAADARNDNDNGTQRILQTRARRLPKSIVGRFTPSCLVHWGTEMARAVQREQQQQRKSSSLSPSDVALDRMQRAVSAVGRLLLLDRFRPMLLPRHLSDLYWGIFFLNHHCRQHGDRDDMRPPAGGNDEYGIVASQLLPPPWEGDDDEAGERLGRDDDIVGKGIAAPSRSSVVDATWQARACQALLATTTQSPSPWLRLEVANVLSRIAASDLAALIQVFVPASSSPARSEGGGGGGGGGDAGLRLARAVLLAPPTTSSPEPIGERSSSTTAPASSRHMVYLRKVAAQVSAVLDGAARQPQAALEPIVLSTLWAIVDGMPDVVVREQLGPRVDPEALVVGRWRVLLSFVPPFVPTRKLMQLLLRQEEEDAGVSAFMVLVRRAITAPVLHDPSRDGAREALDSLLEWSTDRECALAKNCRSVKATHLVAAALLHAIAHEAATDTMKDASTDSQVASIEAKFKSMVSDVLLRCLPTPDNGHEQAGVDASANQVLSFIFLVLLKMYLQGQSYYVAPDPKMGTATARCLQLLPFVALPILCEECPMESLLNSSTQILELMSVTFGQAARLFQPVGGAPPPGPHGDKVDECRAALDLYGVISGTQVFQLTYSRAEESKDSTTVNNETVLSLCSLLLGVLIGILELGSPKRHEADEALLQSFPAQLLPLAGMHAGGARDAEPASEVPAELASMAGHAMALILARQAPSTEAMLLSSVTPLSISDRIVRLKEELRSPEVPIRASAVVSLRRLACNLLDKAEPGNQVHRVLALLIESLKDADSYVYLAAIQTIAFLVDTKPESLLPLVGRAVATGELRVEDNVEDKLTPEQRVKLAEALVSCIRRKVAVDEYLNLLLDVMVFGGSDDDSAVEPTTENGLLIQRATHEYFVVRQGDDEHQTDTVSDFERWEEKVIRVRTGGPLFEEEKDEVVRAAKLSVVTELVITSHPSVLSRYCHVLVQCSIVCLQQGRSRPVRRTGALLARELYSAAIREHDGEPTALTSNGRAASYPYSVALVGAAKERALAATLKRCLNLEDVNDLGIDQQRLVDPATSARCQEALSAREEAEEIGILPAARLLAETEAAANSRPMLRMLLEPSRKEDSAPTLSRMIVEM